MQNTKDKIVEVSFFLFLQKSFKSVTIKDIVEKASVSKGAFYHYFDSKDDVFIAVFKKYYSDVLQDNFTHLNRNTLKEFYIDSLVVSQIMFKKLFKTSPKNSIGKANHFLMLFEAAHRNEKFKTLVNEQGEIEMNAWKEIVEKAQNTGEITTKIDALDIAKMFIYIGDGHGMHQSFRKDRYQFDPSETRKLYDSLYELLKK